MLIKRTIEVDYEEKNRLVVPYRISHNAMLEAAEFLINKGTYLCTFWEKCFYTYAFGDELDVPFMIRLSLKAGLKLIQLEAVNTHHVVVYGNIEHAVDGREEVNARRAKEYITEVDFYSLCYKKIYDRDGKCVILDQTLENVSSLHGNRTDTRVGMPLSVVQTYK